MMFLSAGIRVITVSNVSRATNSGCCWNVPVLQSYYGRHCYLMRPQLLEVPMDYTVCILLSARRYVTRTSRISKMIDMHGTNKSLSEFSGTCACCVFSITLIPIDGLGMHKRILTSCTLYALCTLFLWNARIFFGGGVQKFVEFILNPS
jgi:hypothetical protein